MFNHWWIFVLVFGGWWLFSYRAQSRDGRHLDALHEADEWFRSKQVDTDSIQFSTYHDANLTRRQGATIVVGVGATRQGERLGFALEVIVGQGVVEAEVIVPEDIATWHERAARTANMNQRPLLDELVIMVDEYRKRYPD